MVVTEHKSTSDGTSTPATSSADLCKTLSSFRIPVISPATFTGSEDVENFFVELELAAAVNSWPLANVPLFVKKFLSKEALALLNLLILNHKPPSYENFKQEFLKQFVDPTRIQKLELALQALKLDT